MWGVLLWLILSFEVALLACFLAGCFRRRRLNRIASFFVAVFAVDFVLQSMPFVYSVVVLKADGNRILGLLDCLGATVKLFVGEVGVAEEAEAFATAFPQFPYVFALGVGLALLATVSTAVVVFSNSVRNNIRLSRALKADVCDVVVGNSPQALQYAKTCNAVLLLDDRDTAAELMEEGYAVLRKSFSTQLFTDRHFNKTTRYNVVCPGDDKTLDYIDAFIAYKKAKPHSENIYLYVEVEGEMADTFRREIIEKSGFEAWMTTFCSYELLARTFTEENPVTRFLPASFVEEGAVRPQSRIHLFLLGFGKQGRELYRQSILNNQLVTYVDGEYKLLPIQYHVCDSGIEGDEWSNAGIRESLAELDATRYFPLPELPFEAEAICKAPDSREVFRAIKAATREDNSFCFVIVDTEDDCRNIEIGARLKTLLFGVDNYHVFVRSEASFAKDDATVSYFGRIESVFTHDVVVNDSLSAMAKKLNEIYTAQYAGDERGRPDFDRYIREKAEADWRALDHFTLYSNIYAAMNLRVKLNLLGLDYAKDGRGEGAALIAERHRRSDTDTYDAYLAPSIRNALIAQEHARWNAYHLLEEYLPLEKNGITVKSDDGKKVRFNVKNPAAKRHACLTTHKGLDVLSSYLAERAGGGAEAKDYDYYGYDEMLLLSAEELLRGFGYSVVEKT